MSLTRTTRALLGLTTVAALAVTALPATAASAAGPRDVIALRPGSSPEGITSDGTTFWAGAMSNGAIFRGDLLTGERHVLVVGAPDRSARGMQLDPATRTLWVAGEERQSDGSRRSYVTAYDADSGAKLRRVRVFGQRFLNDVQVTPQGVFVTDSLSRQLVKVTATGVTLLPMTGDWKQPAGFGANGIRLLPDGDLLVTNSTTGELFRVDPGTGVADRIELSGRALTSGDGLVVRGRTVYVVYGFSTDSVAVVQLDEGVRSGRVVGELTDSDLDRPTTAVLAAGALYAVNGRFGTPPTPTTPYQVVRVELS